jgi:hypothetical protein
MIVLVVALAVLATYLKSTRVRYAAKALMTKNELHFYGLLERAIPEYRIHAQVCMGALLQPAVPSNSRNYHRIRATFAQKIIDYVIQERGPEGGIVALVELDDRTHSAERDAVRDAMCRQAGYRVIRWDSRDKPSVQAIRHAFFPQS